MICLPRKHNSGTVHEFLNCFRWLNGFLDYNASNKDYQTYIQSKPFSNTLDEHSINHLTSLDIWEPHRLQGEVSLVTSVPVSATPFNFYKSISEVYHAWCEAFW